MKNLVTFILVLCFVAIYPSDSFAQQKGSKDSGNAKKGQIKESNLKGKTVLVWAVKEKGSKKGVITTSYTPWLTKQETIDGITKMRGKSWETLQKEGAELIQREMVIENNQDKSQKK